MFEIREGFQVKHPSKLTSWPDKLNGKLRRFFENQSYWHLKILHLHTEFESNLEHWIAQCIFHLLTEIAVHSLSTWTSCCLVCNIELEWRGEGQPRKMWYIWFLFAFPPRGIWLLDSWPCGARVYFFTVLGREVNSSTLADVILFDPLLWS